MKAGTQINSARKRPTLILNVVLVRAAIEEILDPICRGPPPRRARATFVGSLVDYLDGALRGTEFRTIRAHIP
jgi:hypothetical protein